MEREATIYDIAKELNLSASTVSRALQNSTLINKETKKKVEECARRLGYRSNAFASNLRKKSTNTLGVIVPRLDSNFMSACLAGMEEVASKEGYNLIISQSLEEQAKEARNAKTMFNNRVDGLIVSLALNTKSIAHFQPFFEKQVPVVFFDRVPDGVHSTSVVIDNFQAAFQATNHLVEQGCQRLVHVTTTVKSTVYAQREDGFVAAVTKAGKPFSVLGLSELSLQSGREAAMSIAAMQPMPDGVFVSNDMAAAGCLLQLQEMGVFDMHPIAIVGFNNDPVATITKPSLSTVEYPGREAGIIAMRTLIDHLKGRTDMSVTNTIVLHSKLIVRESTQRKKV